MDEEISFALWLRMMLVLGLLGLITSLSQAEPMGALDRSM